MAQPLRCSRLPNPFRALMIIYRELDRPAWLSCRLERKTKAAGGAPTLFWEVEKSTRQDGICGGCLLFYFGVVWNFGILRAPARNRRVFYYFYLRLGNEKF